ncbi:Hexosaminidase D [Acropora cervicornis]|uniref:beta-N-acetylhexosaminidase n=1 Tax=Acropora cervicornis TaxID=6130 RepID=A0AAD9QXK3_ACRCE|nr:Hexosaminidase D [Acropora cervicornis]
MVRLSTSLTNRSLTKCAFSQSSFRCSTSIIDSTQYNSHDAIVTRLLIELSSTRQNLRDTKELLKQAEQKISNLTATPGVIPGQNAAVQKDKPNNKFSGHKLIHLDLGGAPPKLTYLLELLPYFRYWNATGLLIEYADTFPYDGELQVIQGPDAYSKEEVSFLIKEALQNELIVIPLVQTFGHLEFVLKHKQFAHLRETAKYTNSICPNDPESAELVKKMIDQVAELHRGIKWFHVGADEVWNLKTCKTCLEDRNNKSMIFLKHMIPVLEHVRSRNLIPIMWDDMMREWTIDFLKVVGKLAEPMIWYYRTDLKRHFSKEMYQRYLEAFPRIWTASAFKGATGPNNDFVSISKHVSNNLQWVEIMNKISETNEVLGIALTGWSRYDHYGTLCELLPAAIPSLVFCLKAVNEHQMNEVLRNEITTQLGFSNRIDVEGTEYYDDKEKYGDFPGHEIYELTLKLKDIHHALRLVHSTEKGWMLRRQLLEKRLSYFRLRFARMKSIEAATAYADLRSEAETLLSQIYSNSTVQEWLSDKIDDRITDAQIQRRRIENVQSIFYND